MGTPKYSSISLKTRNMRDMDGVNSEANSWKHYQCLGAFPGAEPPASWGRSSRGALWKSDSESATPAQRAAPSRSAQLSTGVRLRASACRAQGVRLPPRRVCGPLATRSHSARLNRDSFARERTSSPDLLTCRPLPGWPRTSAFLEENQTPRAVTHARSHWTGIRSLLLIGHWTTSD